MYSIGILIRNIANNRRNNEHGSTSQYIIEILKSESVLDLWFRNYLIHLSILQSSVNIIFQFLGPLVQRKPTFDGRHEDPHGRQGIDQQTHSHHQRSRFAG